MPTELEGGKKLEFDEEVYDIGPGKLLSSQCTFRCMCMWHCLGKGDKTATQPESSGGSYAGSQGDFDSPILRLSYTSLTTPTTTLDHNLATHSRRVLLCCNARMNSHDNALHVFVRRASEH